MRRRLAVSYIGLAVLLLMVLEIPLGILDAKRERALAAEGAERQATAMAVSASPALVSGRTGDLASLVEQYRAQAGGEVSIFDSSGRAVARSLNRSDSDAAGDGAGLLRIALAGKAADEFGADEGQAWVRAAAPVYSGSVLEGAVLIGLPATSTERRVHEIWISLGAVGAALVGLALVVGLLMARSLTRPLSRLQATAAAFATGDLDARAPISGPAEVEAVAREFNRMGGHLRELIGAQSRFVSEASHQLRSPLTALRLRLENLEEELDGTHAVEMAAARREVARLSRIVDGLLVIGRAEGETPPTAPVDVGRVIGDRCEAWSALAEERLVQLESRVELPPARKAALVPGDIDQILDNLMANAIDAMPEGGRLVVSAAGSAGGPWTIHVTDEGPGMSDEDRRRAFDRFWQGPGASAGRSGLGLAIVRQLAVRNGATVELRPADPHGIDATVVLPPDVVLETTVGKDMTKVR